MKFRSNNPLRFSEFFFRRLSARIVLALLAALTFSFALLYLTAATARADYIIKDTEPPKIVEAPIIDSPEDGDAYRAGESISVTLTFSEPVQVTGKPRLRLMIGDKGRWAKYDSSASSGASLTFNYVVKSGDKDDDGVSVKKNSLRLKGGSIQDGSGNKAKLKHEAVSGLASHKVNGSTIKVEPQQNQDPSPSAPTGVKAEPIGDMEVKVSWDAQDTGPCPATRYVLRLYDLSDESVVTALSLKRTNYTVIQLEANKAYEAEVFLAGCGKWSPSTYHKFTTTGMDASSDPVKLPGEPMMPPNPPTGLTITKNGTTVTISWTAASSNAGRCTHSYYVLSFTNLTNPKAESVERWDIHETSTTVKNVPVGGDTYDVRVFSHSLACHRASPAAWKRGSIN